MIEKILLSLLCVGFLINSANAAAAEIPKSLLLWYKFDDAKGNIVTDAAGNGYDGTLYGSESWGQGINEGCLQLEANSYVKIPNGLLQGLNSITVSAFIRAKSADVNQWIFGFGSDDKKYLFVTARNHSGRYRGAITVGSWRSEQGVEAGALDINQWRHIALVINGDTNEAILYQDGVEIHRNTNVSLVPSDLYSSNNDYTGYIGKSFYAPDPYFTGDIDDFRVYGRALNAEEILSLYHEIHHYYVENDRDSLTLGDISTVVDDLTLPTKGEYGSTISWKSGDESIVGSDGRVTRPIEGEKDAVVTLTAVLSLGKITHTKEFHATVLEDNLKNNLAAAAGNLSLGLTSVVTGDLDLPVSGDYGTGISWTSSDLSLLESDGTVHRPGVGEGRKPLLLTAAITLEGLQTVKNFNLEVLDEYAGYIMAYYKEGGTNVSDALHLAYSEDGLNWTALNGNHGVLFPLIGSRHIRDPFVFRKQDGSFGLVAADNNSDSIYIWDSKDLLKFKNERLVKMNNEGIIIETPQVIYDHKLAEYKIIWSGAGVVYANTTKDFKHCSASAPFFGGDYPVEYTEINTSNIPDGAICSSVVPVTRLELEKLKNKLLPVDIAYVEEMEITSIKGEKPVLPSSIEVKLTNGKTETMNVEWDLMEPKLYANVGSFTVEGTLIDSFDYPNPLIEQRADPMVYKHTDGCCYFTASYPDYDRIIMRKAQTIAGLKDAEEVVIWKAPKTGPMVQHIWAPEIHFINGKWYIYVAAAPHHNRWHINTFVFECADEDPLTGDWKLKGEMVTDHSGFTLDATVLMHQGRQYVIFAEKPSSSNIYIAEMENPWTIKGKQVLIAKPEYAWETVRENVNEGPAVIKNEGKIYVAFSAAATDENYRIGLLTASETSDLLDPDSWEKTPYPIFSTNYETSEYGPGHNFFTTAEDGVTPINIYHARPEKVTTDPLYTPNRHARAQRVFWNYDGTPNLGVPGHRFDVKSNRAKIRVNIVEQ